MGKPNLDDERVAVARDLLETEKAIVETVAELDALLLALDERQRQARQVGVNVKPLAEKLLKAALYSIRFRWQQTRADLVEVPPKPDPRLAAIHEARGDIARLAGLAAANQVRLRAAHSTHGDGLRELMQLATNYNAALRQAQQRLANHLLLGDADEKREGLALLDALDERGSVVVAL